MTFMQSLGLESILENFKLKSFALLRIPLLALVRPKILKSSNDSVEIWIPLCRRNKNHLGSLYFGALCIGADLAAGLLVMRYLNKKRARGSSIFSHFNAEFLKRATSDTRFVCSEGSKVEKLVELAFTTGERQAVPLKIEAFATLNDVQTCVAKFDLTVSIKFPKTT